MRLRSGIQCDLRVVAPAEYPFALNYFTGSKEHNIVVRNRALQRGWTLNEYRLAPAPAGSGQRRRRRESREPIPVIHDEAELYRAFGLDYIQPELRENCGEFEAAAEGRLPRLIEKENLRGTFHCHTTASDGRNSLEEMADAAQELGLQYLGIADHSRSSVQARRARRGAASRAGRSDPAAERRARRTSASSPAWNATSCATARSIFPTNCSPSSITSSPRCTPPSTSPKPR